MPSCLASVHLIFVIILQRLLNSFLSLKKKFDTLVSGDSVEGAMDVDAREEEMAGGSGNGNGNA